MWWRVGVWEDKDEQDRIHQQRIPCMDGLCRGLSL